MVILIPIIAFVRVNKEPVLNVFLNFVKFSLDRKNYTWKKREELASLYKLQKAPEIAPKKEALIPKFQAGRLKETKKMVELKK